MYNIYSIAKFHEMHTTYRVMGKLEMSSTLMESFCSFLPLLLNLVLHFLRVKKIHRIPKAPNFHKQPCHLYAIELAVLLFPTPSFLLLLLLSISILHIVGSPDFPMMWTPCCDRFFSHLFPLLYLSHASITQSFFSHFSTLCQYTSQSYSV